MPRVRHRAESHGPRKRANARRRVCFAAALAAAALALAAAVVKLAAPGAWPGKVYPPPRPDARAIVSVLEDVFEARASALVRGDPALLERYYETSGSGVGRQALEHEARKLRYVHAWASKRGVAVTAAYSHLQVKSVALGRRLATAVVWQSLNVRYRPRSQQVVTDSAFGIRTRHRITLVRRDGEWLVRSDEYTDPLGEDALVPELAPAVGLEPANPVDSMYPAPYRAAAPVRAPSPATPLPGPATAGTQGLVYDRKKAIAYADRYCGVMTSPRAEFGYNPRYRDYTDMGGDCTNFVSQVLGDREAGGIPQDSTWHYDFSSASGGSKAWTETEAFSAYLTESGTALLLARGSFSDVQAPGTHLPRGALAELDPGDVIAYEEEGEIRHFGVVTARDPSGYLLVNTHTADRYRVPWDLGWDKDTVFWLFEIVR